MLTSFYPRYKMPTSVRLGGIGVDLTSGWPNQYPDVFYPRLTGPLVLDEFDQHLGMFFHDEKDSLVLEGLTSV